MGTNKKRAAVVVDANVVIATIIRYGGFTAKILRNANRLFDVFVSDYLLEEVRRHVNLISKKSGLSVEEIKLAINIISKRFKTANIKSEIIFNYVKYVRDPKDAQYVALAFYLKERYQHVFLLTYNKKDFYVEKLKDEGIEVLTPKEFIAFLRENVA